jgi:hypothetical protein
VVLFGALGGLLFYVFEGYKESFHSDSATKVLIAQEMINSGQFFPPGFHYGNGELWVVTMQLFVLPFLFFLPEGYLAHAFGATFNLILLLVVTYKFQEGFNKNKSSRIIVTAIVASGVSSNWLENLFGQYSYSLSLVATMAYIMLATSIFSKLFVSNIRLVGYLAIVALIVYFLSFQSPMRVMIYMLFPMGLVLIFSLTGVSRLTVKFTRFALFSLTNVVALAVGVASREYVGEQLNIADSLSIGVLLDPSEWKNTFFKSIDSVLLLLGAENTGGMTLFSSAGLLMAAKYLISFFLLIGISAGLVSLNKSKDFTSSFYFAFTCATIIVTLLSTSMTNLGENRYWQVAAALALIVGFSKLLEDEVGKFPFVLLVSSFLIALNVFTITAPLRANSEVRPGESSFALIEYLRANNLNYGYASYWNSSKYTILSESEVVIRPVHILGNTVLPFRWLSFESWYEGSDRQNSFLMLVGEETQSLVEEELSALGITPSTRKEFDGKVIFVFDFDIANRLTGWDPSFANGDNWPVTSSTFTKIGTLTETSSNGVNRQCLIARKGEFGLVHYGPYVSIEPGTYFATFEISSLEQTSEQSYIEITYNGGRDSLGKKQVNFSSGVQIIEFEVETFTEGLELIYFSGGESESLFCGVSLKSQ